MGDLFYSGDYSGDYGGLSGGWGDISLPPTADSFTVDAPIPGATTIGDTQTSAPWYSFTVDNMVAPSDPGVISQPDAITIAQPALANYSLRPVQTPSLGFSFDTALNDITKMGGAYLQFKALQNNIDVAKMQAETQMRIADRTNNPLMVGSGGTSLVAVPRSGALNTGDPLTLVLMAAGVLIAFMALGKK